SGTSTLALSTLSLHDALPIYRGHARRPRLRARAGAGRPGDHGGGVAGPADPARQGPGGRRRGGPRRRQGGGGGLRPAGPAPGGARTGRHPAGVRPDGPRTGRHPVHRRGGPHPGTHGGAHRPRFPDLSRSGANPPRPLGARVLWGPCPPAARLGRQRGAGGGSPGLAGDFLAGSGGSDGRNPRGPGAGAHPPRPLGARVLWGPCPPAARLGLQRGAGGSSPGLSGDFLAGSGGRDGRNPRGPGAGAHPTRPLGARVLWGPCPPAARLGRQQGARPELAGTVRRLPGGLRRQRWAPFREGREAPGPTRSGPWAPGSRGVLVHPPPDSLGSTASGPSPPGPSEDLPAAQAEPRAPNPRAPGAGAKPARCLGPRPRHPGGPGLRAPAQPPPATRPDRQQSPRPEPAASTAPPASPAPPKHRPGGPPPRPGAAVQQRAPGTQRVRGPTQPYRPSQAGRASRAQRYGICAARASRRLSRRLFTRRAGANSGMTAPITSCSAHPVWSSSWPLGASSAHAASRPMDRTIHDSMATARRPRGFGYSTRLTISQAVPRIASSVATNGSSRSTIETTVSAPNGEGMPWKVPSLTVTQEN